MSGPKRRGGPITKNPVALAPETERLRDAIVWIEGCCRSLTAAETELFRAENAGNGARISKAVTRRLKAIERLDWALAQAIRDVWDVERGKKCWQDGAAPDA